MKINKIIDLSVTIYQNMPAGSLSPVPDLKPTAFIARDGYNSEVFSAGTHSGTHFDAPRHFDDEGTSIDALDLNSLIGEGYCINVENLGREITRRHLEERWLPEFDGKIILLNTGWCKKKRSPSKEFYYEYPGLASDTVDFFLSHKIGLIGIDSLGIEPTGHREVHQMGLLKGLVFIEDLANLDQLVDRKKYFVIALPLKLLNAGGSFARVVALDID
jgi:arylformamidase